jgi:hypothetical protein
MFDGYELNVIGILISSAAAMFIGFVWYSPAVFGKPWMTLMKLKKEDLDGMKNQMVRIYAMSFLTCVIMIFVLDVLISALFFTYMWEVLMTAFFLWLGFVAAVQIGGVLWEKKPMGLFWINSLHTLCVFFVSSIILFYTQI